MWKTLNSIAKHVVISSSSAVYLCLCYVLMYANVFILFSRRTHTCYALNFFFNFCFIFLSSFALQFVVAFLYSQYHQIQNVCSLHFTPHELNHTHTLTRRKRSELLECIRFFWQSHLYCIRLFIPFECLLDFPLIGFCSKFGDQCIKPN